MKKLLLLACSSLPLALSAQGHHEVGVFVGAGGYYGDLQTKVVPDLKTVNPSLGILYKYFVNPRLGFRFGATYLKVSGADSLSDIKVNKARNLNFTNNIYELYGAVEFNLFQIDRTHWKFSPYIFAGIGAFYSNPWALDNENQKQKLRNLSTEGQGLPGYPGTSVYPLINAAFPIGGGIKFLIGKTVTLSAEVGLRYTTTDYLDDVSGSYVNLDTLMKYKGAKSVEMSFRGNTLTTWDGNYPNDKYQRGYIKNNDWYWTVGLTATIYFDAFGNRHKDIQTSCPRIFGSSR